MLSRWAQYTHKGPCEREARSKAEEREEMLEAEVGVMHFEDGGRGHEPWNAGSFQRLKGRRRDSALEPSDRTQTCPHLLSSTVRLILDF